MQKQPPTLGRILVMVGFALSCFGLLLFLWLAFGGAIPLKPRGYRFYASFGEATQLATQADVRISGVTVGKVQQIQSTPDGRSRVQIQLDSRYAPIPKDTKAILRQKTLLGETYIELTPGHKRRGNMLPENGTLPISQVSPTVELDEVFRSFNPKTREAFREWFQSMAGAVTGRGLDISDAIGNLAPFSENATTLLQLLDAQHANVRGLVNDTGVVFDALSARDSQLASLIQNSNRVFTTTAQRDADLQATFRALPTFEAESNLTINRLFRFAVNTNPLITQLRPAARELSPTLVQLAGLAPDLKALFRDLNPLITASKAGLPATAGFLNELHPLLGSLDSPLRQLNPALRFVSAYSDELRNFFSGPPASTQSCQVEARSNGTCVHYLRTANPLNPENLAVYQHRIGSNRTNAYELPSSSGFGYATILPGKGGHLLSFETRQCGRVDPTILIQQGGGGSPIPLPPPLNQIVSLPLTLLNNIVKFAFAGGGSAVPAPPCTEQPTFRSITGKATKYPQLVADPPGR